jgi:hypothetical protein
MAWHAFVSFTSWECYLEICGPGHRRFMVGTVSYAIQSISKQLAPFSCRSPVGVIHYLSGFSMIFSLLSYIRKTWVCVGGPRKKRTNNPTYLWLVRNPCLTQALRLLAPGTGPDGNGSPCNRVRTPSILQPGELIKRVDIASSPFTNSTPWIQQTGLRDRILDFSRPATGTILFAPAASVLSKLG